MERLVFQEPCFNSLMQIMSPSFSVGKLNCPQFYKSTLTIIVLLIFHMCCYFSEFLLYPSKASWKTYANSPQSMQYYQNLIYSHRPWMSKGYLQPQPPKGPGFTHAREMCINSAISIAKILVLYETRYTLRRINIKAVSITSSAVLLLLFAAVSQYQTEENENIIAHLSTCFRALDEFSLSWQSANRAKDLLVRLQHKWEIRTRAAKPDRGADGADYPPRKRSRTLNGSDSADPNNGRLSIAQPETRDFQLESGLGWMLMLSGQLPSDGDEDLYSFVANAGIPESENETR